MTTQTNGPLKIDSAASFEAAVHWAFGTAFARGARRIVCVDPDFADWPLDAPALLEGLSAWLRTPQRRLVLLADRWDEMPRRHPRFVAWRPDWVHAVQTLSPTPGSDFVLPTLLLDDEDLVLRVADRVHWRGRAELDRRDAHAWRDEIDAVLQRSEPAFPAYHLGL